MTYRQSVCLRGLAALGVFFCHAFPYVNLFGFLFVAVFFYLSGYGFRVTGRAENRRLPLIYVFRKVYPLFALFVLFSLPSVYFLGRFELLPSSWFLFPYALILFGLCFLRSEFVFLLVGAFCLFFSLDADFFCYPWASSWFMFFVGYWGFKKSLFPVFVAWCCCFYFNPFTLFTFPMAFAFVGLLFLLRARLGAFYEFGLVSMPFYVVHYLPLSVFGVNDFFGLPDYSHGFFLVVSLMISVFFAVGWFWAQGNLLYSRCSV